jgi:hypothetical protein
MKRMAPIASCFALPFLVAATVHISHAGIIIRVPADYQRIQEAVNWASDGDEIVVSPGVYLENVLISQKGIVLRSIDPTSLSVVQSTVIDGAQRRYAVFIEASDIVACTLTGFTIQNGASTGGYQGSGVSGGGKLTRIERNIIVHNSNSNYGGGICFCHGTIADNVISSNSAPHGGGIAFSNATITRNLVTGNSVQGLNVHGGGIYFCNGTIENSVITSNTASVGGGIARCSGTIRNCTIVGNRASDYGGGIDDCNGTLVNNIIWGNFAPSNPQMHDFSIPSYSCIEGYTVGGVGNTGSNPRFRGPYDYHLLPSSPCVDTGSNRDSPATDRDGSPRPFDGNGDGLPITDMGAYEFHEPIAASRNWLLFR